MSDAADNTSYSQEKSVRLTSTQADRLERAAKVRGIRASDFIREAIERRCNEVLTVSLADDLADYIGVIALKDSPGAHRLDEVVAAAIASDLDQDRRRSLP